MKRLILGIAISAIATLNPALGWADDTEIAQAVVKKLKEHQTAGTLKDFDINVSVEDGRVWVKGKVANLTQQTLVLEAARRIKGVTLVVNDIRTPGRESEVLLTDEELLASSEAVEAKQEKETAPASSRNIFREVSNSLRKAINGNTESQQKEIQQTANWEAKKEQPDNIFRFKSDAIGTGISKKSAGISKTSAEQQIDSAAPLPPVPQASSTPVQVKLTPQQPASFTEVAPQPYAQGLPVAFAPSRSMSQQRAPYRTVGHTMPIPQQFHRAGGVAPARYDHPSMPSHAWPSYASHPNYAALSYPTQYSPSAFPYIGPFYPYPQVPLGWRKVTLEWDDGWWMLDFKSK